MSWLVSSIANSLKLDDDEEDTSADTSIDDNRSTSPTDPNHEQSPSNSDPQPRGVKEDLSEISKTLTRQFWGVASFLAPPPTSEISDPDFQPSHPFEEPDQDDSDSDPNVISGLRSDLSEIGGRFRTGISKLSSNKAVTEFTKIASNFLQFGSEEMESIDDFAQRGVVGVTEEVVAFARNIALHPETWLDFPLPDEDEVEEDFDLSDVQQEHALAVERLAPTLAALRIELCPGYMSEGCFWKIYFVLVHPRLARHDAELLSSPQIAKTRAMLTYDLKNRAGSKPDGPVRGSVASEAVKSKETEEHLTIPSNNEPVSEPVNISVLEPETSKSIANIEVDKHPIDTTEEAPVIDKQVIEEVSKPQTNNAKTLSNVPVHAENYEDDDDGDDWLKEEPSDISGPSGTAIPLEDPEDVSFSDLEEDDEDEVHTKSKKVINPSTTSKETNDWLDIEDIDVA